MRELKAFAFCNRTLYLLQFPYGFVSGLKVGTKLRRTGFRTVYIALTFK